MVFAFHVLRVGLALTFLWIGFLILQDLSGWAMVPSWVADALPVSPATAMLAVGIFDVAAGALMLANVWMRLAAGAAAAHLALVLAVSGINAITVRDIGLLGGALALFINSLPNNYQFWLKKPQKVE